MHDAPPRANRFSLSNITLNLPSLSGNIEILKQISLSSKLGESLAIIGPSGAGKSSLLMILAGIERPTSGAVIINDSDITHLSESQLAAWRRHEIGVVFQSFRLISTLTALDNVALPLQLAGDRDANPKARQALADLGLESRLSHFPEQLSGGEQQRVALARAWVTEPSLLLADEPTGNLDRKNGALVMDMLFAWHQNTQHKDGTHKPRNLVLITHDVGLAARCDRVITLEDGVIVNDTAAGGAEI